MARTWLGTLNNPAVDPEEYLLQWADKAAYVCGQLEEGKEGTRHIQFYVNFKKPVRMSALKKVCGKAHFEPVKVDNGADRYCMKEDTRVAGPWEFGIKPFRRNNATDWEEVWAKAKEGNLMAIPADVRVRSIFALEKIKRMHMVIPEREAPKTCKWIYGPTGSGKTRGAHQDYPGAYKKLANKWWDGYNGQPAVILDDLGKDSAKALVNHLKLWADPWQNQPGETKGGQCALVYDHFIVTSNFSIKDLDIEEVDR